MDEIYVYTRKTFGPEQARKYTDELKVCCKRIPSFPGLGKDLDNQPGILVAPCQSHKIFYRLERGNILILRILHQRMDPKDRL